MNLRKQLYLSAVILLCCCILVLVAYRSRPPRMRFPGVERALRAENSLNVELIDPSYHGKPVASGEDLIYPAKYRHRYIEISSERLQELSPSLSSCDGLTVVGRLNHAGQTTHRWTQNQSYFVTIPEVAYAYPDPSYPDLIVISLDGQPVILEAFELEP